MGFSFNNPAVVIDSGEGQSFTHRRRIKSGVPKKKADSRSSAKECLTPENVFFLESLGYKVKNEC